MDFARIKPKLMLQKCNVFLKLSWKQKLLFFINFILCGVARAFIVLFPLKGIAPYLGVLNKNIICSTILTRKQCGYAIQLRRSIALVAKYTPWNSNCLTQAMVAKFWCMRLGIPYALYIGFRKDANEPSGYASHAWITAGPIAISGDHCFSTFHVISSYVPKTLLGALEAA